MARPHRTRSFSTESSTVIAADAERIRARIGAWETWPEWQSEILSTEQPQRAEPHQIVHGRARLLGFDVHGRSLVLPSPHHTVEQDVVVGVRMTVRYMLEERGSVTAVTHRLDADLPGGLAGTVLSVLLARRLKRMQIDLLRRLKAQLEESA